MIFGCELCDEDYFHFRQVDLRPLITNTKQQKKLFLVLSLTCEEEKIKNSFAEQELE